MFLTVSEPVGALERPPKEVSLTQVAPELAQTCSMYARLDALPYNLSTKILRELRYELNNRDRSLLGKVLHERLVELHDVEWELVKIRQGRIAGTEVIERNFEAIRSKLLKQFLEMHLLCSEEINV